MAITTLQDATNPFDPLHETYLRSKRYLIFFSGALLLSVLVGLDPNTENGILPWKIARPEYWGLILYAAVLYYLCQLALFWEAQPQPAKALRQHLIDLWLSAAIAFAALAVLVAALIYQRLNSLTPSILNDWPAIVVLGLLPVLAVLLNIFVIRPSVKTSRVEAATQQAQLADDLVSYRWELVFNPLSFTQSNGNRGSKRMVFAEEGKIVDGRNKNEDSWRINGQFLELLEEGGLVYSRFKYDPVGRRFEHTNDSDTRSIRGQYLLARDRLETKA